MSEALQTEVFDAFGSGEQAGFRLHRFEVYNWGTFHEKVWILTPQGKNTLVTGDIGSGKSTLVDALTTLLVPAQRITYNKAAGAEARERTLRTYVLGHYRSERSEGSLSPRPVALRDYNNYSVVLGHFRNEGYQQDVTLAQVFWLRDQQGQPDRFYVVADGALTIADDFADFGSDINQLKKRLRANAGVRVYDHFPAYGGDFRRRFGINSEQALELFNQTVSMKSVGNLTDFVRNHMLEPTAVADRIDALMGHFENLDRAHQAVITAREQIAALEPLEAGARRYEKLDAQLKELRSCRQALHPWFAQQKAQLLQERLDKLGRQLERLAGRISRLTARHKGQSDRRDDLKQAIAASGGHRMEQLKREIQQSEDERERRQRRAQKYNGLARQLVLAAVKDEAGFLANRRAAQEGYAALEDLRAQAQNDLTEATVALQTARRQYEEVDEELISLRGRRSNIPARMLALRRRLCDALGVDEETLPFVGELIQVRADAREWEGAIERVLRNFGLSVLVPDRLYRQAAQWVDRTHLRERLVYYWVREPRRPAVFQLHPRSLVDKLELQSESEFYPWLEQRLAQQFDYACCTDLEQFRRETKAITKLGQIKVGGTRHEKDDRHAIGDRARYVLGWSNEDKIAALEQQARTLQQQVQKAREQVSAAQKELGRLQRRGELYKQLQGFSEFVDLDWQSLAVQIQALEEELAALTAGSHRLRTLQSQLEVLEEAMEVTAQKLDDARREEARREERRAAAEQMLAEVRQELARSPEATAWFDRLAALWEEAPAQLRAAPLTVESVDRRQTEMREWIQSRLDAKTARLGRLRDKILDFMRQYHHRWPLQVQEIDVAIEAIPAYRELLQQLQRDDLPRFEGRFKQLLRENTIKEVANFQAHLNWEREAIQERIDTINRSLQEIDYNRDRYIELLAESTPDPEVRQFREDLRACTEGTLTGSGADPYSEAKFLQVKAIIERFRGREEQTQIDKQWTHKVTDVRNWFVFSAVERWRADDKEYEHYSDTSGKSGGQKEKLAYTVLAASLAYQFGLEWGARRSRSFRFVVIDEAFGRGSDESARFGLNLFQQLNLQVLVVTPLQKIHVIEPFVASVAFVHSEDDRQSMVHNLTIEQYRARRDARGRSDVS